MSLHPPQAKKRLFFLLLQSLGQCNIFTPVCHSVHRGGLQARRPPRKEAPPGRETPPPGKEAPPGRRHPPAGRPPRRSHPHHLGKEAPPGRETPPPGKEAPPRKEAGRPSRQGAPLGRETPQQGDPPSKEAPPIRETPRQGDPPATAVGGTHPTGMHSCVINPISTTYGLNANVRKPRQKVYSLIKITSIETLLELFGKKAA